jgi:hypothetical protein
VIFKAVTEERYERQYEKYGRCRHQNPKATKLSFNLLLVIQSVSDVDDRLTENMVNISIGFPAI